MGGIELVVTWLFYSREWGWSVHRQRDRGTGYEFFSMGREQTLAAAKETAERAYAELPAMVRRGN